MASNEAGNPYKVKREGLDWSMTCDWSARYTRGFITMNALMNIERHALPFTARLRGSPNSSHAGSKVFRSFAMFGKD
jgi:hypothetical protein